MLDWKNVQLFTVMLSQTHTRYITRHPDILSGEPIIEGTRTPVRAIAENWLLKFRM